MSCSHDFGNFGNQPINVENLKDKDPNEVTKEDIQASVANIFGSVDPNHDWNLVNKGTISVTADAPLSDIAKVQLLTESPFLNSEAKVLNEAAAQYGDVVSLTYDAPNAYSQLFAACVSSSGEYYVQVFSPGTENLKFTTTSRAGTRAAASDAPTFTTLKLNKPKDSFNAQRAKAGASLKIGGTSYTEWINSKWNDQMWDIADDQTFDNGWKLDNEKNRNHIYRSISNFENNELENVKAIVNGVIHKYTDASNSTRSNNIEAIRNSTYFQTSQNYVTTDGQNPVTLIPIQGYTTEFKSNHIYYYYYRPEDIPVGMSEVDYIKQLPKFKAICFMRVQSSTESSNGTFYRRQEFLLPYYKNAPVEGVNEASPIFPEGYRIGFLNRKDYNGKGDYQDIKSGCTYGDGRLNYEVNHIIGHFKSAMDKSLGGNHKDGMTWTDPRIAIFTANQKTYMAFEEGADCNFSDMVIEIGSGIKKVEEHYGIDYLSYIMCFEDSPIADYDMNDVVLKFERQGQTKVKVTLLACGAYDELYLRGLNGSKLNENTEIHAMFGVPTKTYINTDGNMSKKEPISEEFSINALQRLSDFLETIYVYDKTQDRNITLAGKGDDPHAIVVPADFKYPNEKKCIRMAYPLFSNWARNAEQDRTWFKHCIEQYIYKME